MTRFETPDKLAKYAGIAPKEWTSVGRGSRTRSEHGRRSLHSTFYHIALIHICVNKNGTVRCAQSRAYYEKKLAEGKTKKAAMICLMRVLVRIVWRMLKHREPYWKLLNVEVA